MKSLIQKIILILILLPTLGGCFGSGTYSNLDYYVYPYAGSSNPLKFFISNTEHPLSIGDTIEIENLGPPANIQADQNLVRTCLYATFAFGGIVVNAGYDSQAVTSDGTTPRYSSLYQSTLSQLGPYVVRIKHEGTLSSNIPLAYGSAGNLFSDSFEKYSTSSPGGTPSTPISFSNWLTQLGTAPNRGSVYDRTICFADSSDPIVIHIAELPPSDTSGATAGADSGTTSGGTTGGTTGGDTPGTTPITPPSDEEIAKIQNELQGGGTTLPGGPSSPSTGTAAATPTEQKSGGGGCPLQLDPNSNAPSTAWVWATALCVSGIFIARRRWVRNR